MPILNRKYVGKQPKSSNSCINPSQKECFVFKGTAKGIPSKKWASKRVLNMTSFTCSLKGINCRLFLFDTQTHDSVNLIIFPYFKWNIRHSRKASRYGMVKYTWSAIYVYTFYCGVIYVYTNHSLTLSFLPLAATIIQKMYWVRVYVVYSMMKM
jgi:hypothetical protein